MQKKSANIIKIIVKDKLIRKSKRIYNETQSKGIKLSSDNEVEIMTPHSTSVLEKNP